MIKIPKIKRPVGLQAACFIHIHINWTDKAISLKQDSNSLFFRGLSYIKLGKTDLGCKDLKKSGDLGKKDAYYEINKYCK